MGLSGPGLATCLMATVWNGCCGTHQNALRAAISCIWLLSYPPIGNCFHAPTGGGEKSSGACVLLNSTKRAVPVSDAVTLNLCILWEGELREAARLIHEAHAEDLDDETRGVKMAEAFNAATVALWGLTAEHACVLVGSDEILRSKKKRRSTTSSEGTT